MDDLDWFALRVLPRKEQVAAQLLNRAGVTTYVPVRTVWRRANRYARAKRRVSYPVAPGYVFVGFRAGERPWARVFALPLVTSVVGVGEHPLRIDGRAMADLIWRWGEGYLDAPAAHALQPTGREYAVGDTVEVISGPFVGHRVRVEALTEAGAKILLTVFKASVSTTVPPDKLGAVA